MLSKSKPQGAETGVRLRRRPLEASVLDPRCSLSSPALLALGRAALQNARVDTTSLPGSVYALWGARRTADMGDFDHILNWKLKEGSHAFPSKDGGTCINEAAIV